MSGETGLFVETANGSSTMHQFLRRAVPVAMTLAIVGGVVAVTGGSSSAAEPATTHTDRSAVVLGPATKFVRDADGQIRQVR